VQLEALESASVLGSRRSPTIGRKAIRTRKGEPHV